MKKFLATVSTPHAVNLAARMRELIKELQRVAPDGTSLILQDKGPIDCIAPPHFWRGWEHSTMYHDQKAAIDALQKLVTNIEYHTETADGAPRAQA